MSQRILEEMVISLLVLLFFGVIEATDNHFVRVDTSAPELEIAQREYANPVSANDLAQNSIEEKSSPSYSETKGITTIEKNTDTKKQDETGKVNNEQEKKERKHLFAYSDSMKSTLKIINYDEELTDLDEEDETFSVSSYNIPKLPSKLIGPEKKPYKELPFNGVGPAGIDEVDKPSCNTFSRTARFNPYSVLNIKWFNFYRWDSQTTPLVIEFMAPTSWELNAIRKPLEKHVRHPINWNSRIVVMTDLLYNTTGLLVERSNRGQFWMYPILKNYTRIYEPIDVRFKQTGDNRFLAFVICADDRAYIFSKITEIPRKKDIPDAVATLGWRGRDGRSYLYQGHQWAPIPELTEEEYWTPLKYGKKEHLPPPPEIYDPEEDPVTIFGKRFE